MKFRYATNISSESDIIQEWDIIPEIPRYILINVNTHGCHFDPFSIFTNTYLKNERDSNMLV